MPNQSVDISAHNYNVLQLYARNRPNYCRDEVGFRGSQSRSFHNVHRHVSLKTVFSCHWRPPKPYFIGMASSTILCV